MYQDQAKTLKALEILKASPHNSISLRKATEHAPESPNIMFGPGFMSITPLKKP